MFKKMFGNSEEKPLKMTHEEALKFVMDNTDLSKFDSDELIDSITFEGSLMSDEDLIISSENEIENFNKAGEMLEVLKSMQLEAQKLVDPKDIEKISFNKKMREAIAVLTKTYRPEIAVYSMAIGAKIALILFFGGIVFDNNNGYKLDIESRMNLFFGGIGVGTLAGLVISESGYRKRRENDISNAKIEDLLVIRNGITSNLRLPESTASEVQQHIEYNEFEEIFDKLKKHE